MKPAMRVAALQFKPIRGELEVNRQRLIRLIEEAARQGCELVVAPEMCTSGYVFPDRQSVTPYCETREGDTHQLFSNLAQRLQISLAYGWPELEPQSQRLYNSAAICLAHGQTLFYRKRLLYEADETWAEPGDTPYPRWRTRGGLSASLGICMDLNDPRFRHFLREAKIRVCAFPTNWLNQDFQVWGYWAWCLQGTDTCLVAANTYGTEDAIAFRGESAILDGRVVLAWASLEGDEVLVADVPESPTPWDKPD